MILHRKRPHAATILQIITRGTEEHLKTCLIISQLWYHPVQLFSFFLCCVPNSIGAIIHIVLFCNQGKLMAWSIHLWNNPPLQQQLLCKGASWQNPDLLYRFLPVEGPFCCGRLPAKYFSEGSFLSTIFIESIAFSCFDNDFNTFEALFLGHYFPLPLNLELYQKREACPCWAGPCHGRQADCSQTSRTHDPLRPALDNEGKIRDMRTSLETTRTGQFWSKNRKLWIEKKSPR